MFAKERPEVRIPESRLSLDEDHIKEILARPDNNDTPAKIRLDMGVMMNEHAAVFRTTEGLQVAHEQIKLLKETATNLHTYDWKFK